jgi:hypothetical protein
VPPRLPPSPPRLLRRRRRGLRRLVTAAFVAALLGAGWQFAGQHRLLGGPSGGGPSGGDSSRGGGQASAGGVRGATAAGPTPPGDVTSTGKAPKPAPPAADGATARDGGLAFTLTGMRCGETDVGDWPVRKHAKGRFCLLDMRVTNIGSHTGWVFMGSQRLVDAGGTEYPADEWAWVYNPRSRAFTSTVDPDRTVNGTLVFDTPPDAHFTKLVVHDSPLSVGTSLPLR